MLIWAFICLIIAVVSAIIGYKSTSPTFVLIMKFMVHIFILLFLGLLIVALLSSLPPPSKDKTLLPI